MKWDYEPEDKQAKKILGLLKAWITKNYGKRCKTLAGGCCVCRVWISFDNLKVNL